MIVKNFALLALCAVLCACAGGESKEQRAKAEFEESISNPQNDPLISDVNFKEMTDAETRSIYEVFTGKEFGHGRLFLRTDKNSRDGLYFFVMFETYCKDILAGTKIKLWVHSNAYPVPREWTFEVPDNTTLLRELVLGITGADAKFVDEKVLAWKIEVFSPDGTPLTEKHSWLWSLKEPQPQATPQGSDTARSVPSAAASK